MEEINNGQKDVTVFTSATHFTPLWGTAPQFNYHSLPLEAYIVLTEEIRGLICLLSF